MAKLNWRREFKKRYTPKKLTINEGYGQVKMELNKNSMKRFIRPEWHRDWRETHINKISMSLRRGNHWSESITVNRKAGVFRVLNGNHRIESVKRILKDFPGFKINIRLTVYDNINTDKELEIYEIVNNTKQESRLDKIKAHCINSLIVKKSKNMAITPLFRSAGVCDVNSMSLVTLVIPYLTRRTSSFSGVSQMIDKINALDEDDLDNINDYALFFLDTFGEYTKANMYANTNLWSCLGKVYFNNVNITISKTQLKSRLKRLIQRSTAQLNLYSTGGVDLRNDLYDFLLKHIKIRKELIDVTKDAKSE